MALQIMTDDEIFADPCGWLLNVVGKSGYREFKNQWPAISSKTKVEINTGTHYRWGIANCVYSEELDTLFINR